MIRCSNLVILRQVLLVLLDNKKQQLFFYIEHVYIKSIHYHSVKLKTDSITPGGGGWGQGGFWTEEEISS